MGLRKIIILILPVLCLMLSGCGLQDYPTYTYELTNGLGEKYLINYCEQTDYPENNTRVKIFRGKDKVSDYNGGAYSDCDSYKPSQIMLICSADDVDYYYLRTQSGEYIVADGIADLKMEFNMLLINRPLSDMSDSDKKTYAKLAEIFRKNVAGETADKRFSDCGYDPSGFRALYSYNT